MKKESAIGSLRVSEYGNINQSHQTVKCYMAISKDHLPMAKNHCQKYDNIVRLRV